MRPTKLMAPRDSRRRGGSHTINHIQHFMPTEANKIGCRGRPVPLINHIASRQLSFPESSQFL